MPNISSSIYISAQGFLCSSIISLDEWQTVCIRQRLIWPVCLNRITSLQYPLNVYRETKRLNRLRYLQAIQNILW